MQKGIFYALLTALISGFSIFLGKIFVSQMDPVVFTTLKNLIVAVILTGIVLTPNVRKHFFKISRTDWIKLFSIGIIGGSLPFALFFTGLSMTSATDATIIHKTLFVWIAIMAIIFLGERLRLFQIIGYGVILTAVFWASDIKSLVFDSGQLMILAATILWAAENVIAKKTLKQVPYQIVAWARMTFGLVILISIVVMQGNSKQMISLSAGQIQAVIVGALFLTGYVLAWYKALSLAPATVVSSILVLATPITALLAAGLLHTPTSSSALMSYALLAIGILLIARSTRILKSI